jgi:hypothetical protein
MSIFNFLESKKSDLAKKQAELDKQKIRHEETEAASHRRNALLKLVEHSHALLADECRKLDFSVRDFSPSEIAAAILNGQKMEDLQLRHSAIINFRPILPQIKAAMREQIVEPATRNLRAFEKESKHLLAKVPLPEKSEEPEFIPTKPVDDDARPLNIPSPGVRLMMNLRPGELADAGYEPPKGTGTVTDLDDD